MSRNRIIALSLAIIGGVAVFEFWSASLFPAIDFEPGTLPPLEVGVEWEFDYYKDDVRVGTYAFWVESKGVYDGETAYFTCSRTSVVHGGKYIKLETVYVFNEELAPLEYRLNASLGGELQNITCLFQGWSVDATLVTEESTIEEPVDLPEGAVLIDNFMLGHWDLLFRSFTPVPGRRFKVDAYVPQVLLYRPLELLANKRTRKTTVNGVDYECDVVRAPELNLTFYLYEGDIIKLEDSEQFIVISMNKQTFSSR